MPTPDAAPRTAPRTDGADRPVAVLDIGKSNSKLVLLDAQDGTEMASAVRRNRPLPPAAARDGTPRALDIAATERWLPAAFAALPARSRVGAIVPVAHGAAMVLLDRGGRVVLAPDYEDPVFEAHRAEYDARRDPFEATLSPSLPLGLNLGRQIHHVARSHPALFARVATIVPLAQYWAFRLSGVAATEVTSLGCHTDLWLPAEGRYAPLAGREGWTALFPPLRHAAERLGPVRPSVARRCGLPPDCAVLCGLHDSNASWYRHRVGRDPGSPFSVVSSGTWTVVMSSGADASSLRADRDMLANVDATGALVGTARFMGGREYEAVAGPDAPVPDEAALGRALRSGALVVPPLAPGGQFIGRSGAVHGADALDRPARAALATFYVALLAAHALDLLAAEGETIVDGPLARNALFPRLLATLRPAGAVRLGDDGAGPAGGALALRTGSRPGPTPFPVAPPLDPALPIRGAAVTWRTRWDDPSPPARSPPPP